MESPITTRRQPRKRSVDVGGNGDRADDHEGNVQSLRPASVEALFRQSCAYRLGSPFQLVYKFQGFTSDVVSESGILLSSPAWQQVLPLIVRGLMVSGTLPVRCPQETSSTGAAVRDFSNQTTAEPLPMTPHLSVVSSSTCRRRNCSLPRSVWSR